MAFDAKDSPPWSACNRAGPDFGTVFAQPDIRTDRDGNRTRMWRLTFDRAGEHVALELYGEIDPGEWVVVFDRRFRVERMEADRG